jgi:trans-2,3-dihydro-3-hydroxyanthranilate isomerase
MTEYLIYDVFTDHAFGGNQLAVIPDASRMNEGDLQSIAREFNFSETTFVFPPEKPGGPFRVRIFTPTNEIPFAGHPTIGTAIALAEMTGQTEIVLELGVGPIPCKIKIGQPSHAEFTTTAPLITYDQVPVESIAACLGLARTQIATDIHMPQIASIGLPFALVELDSSAALYEASPNTNEFRKAEANFANNIDLFAIFLYVREGNHINARMFAPLNNVPEDPATGSAAGAIAAFLSQIDGKALNLTIDQGVKMGRPSKINVTTSFDGTKCSAVTISGDAVKTMGGEFAV